MTFELVLCERNYLGKPTGKMKPVFATEDVDKLAEHYYKNSGRKRKRKRKGKGQNQPNQNSSS